jgi:hypothetical protein
LQLTNEIFLVYIYNLSKEIVIKGAPSVPYFVNVLESGLKVGGKLIDTNILFTIRIQSP